MPVVDRNLARIAVYELLYVDEIDDAVAITEAVELARQMSTDDSPALPQRRARPDRRVRHPLTIPDAVATCQVARPGSTSAM